MLKNIIKNNKPSSYNTLDVVTGAVMAFSLYKLYSAATKCVRVRRSSDNAEADIGFNGNYIDIVALNTHLGASDGFVTKWYNQYAGGNDAVQTTSLNQPAISKTTGELFFNNPVYSDGPMQMNVTIYPAIDITASPMSIYANFRPEGDRGWIMTRPDSASDKLVYGLYYFTSSHLYFGLDESFYSFAPTYLDTAYSAWGKSLVTHNGTTVSGNNGGGLLTDAKADTSYVEGDDYMRIGCTVESGPVNNYYFNGYLKTIIMFNEDKRSNYATIASKC